MQIWNEKAIIYAIHFKSFEIWKSLYTNSFELQTLSLLEVQSNLKKQLFNMLKKKKKDF